MSDLTRGLTLLLDRMQSQPPQPVHPSQPTALPPLPGPGQFSPAQFPGPGQLPGQIPGFEGVTDPELLRGFTTLQQRMESQIAQAVAKFQESVAPVTSAVQAQFAQQQEQRGRAMAEALAKEFPAFNTPQLGQMYLRQYADTVAREPWRDRRAIAQEIQQSHDQLVTSLVHGAVQPPATQAGPTPAANVPPSGPQAPLVRPTEPRSVREAGTQLGQTLSAIQQQRS